LLEGPRIACQLPVLVIDSRSLPASCLSLSLTAPHCLPGACPCHLQPLTACNCLQLSSSACYPFPCYCMPAACPCHLQPLIACHCLQLSSSACYPFLCHCMLQIITSRQLLFMHSTACFCMLLSVTTCPYLLPTLPFYFMILSATIILPSNCPAFITCLYLRLSALLSMTLSATTILPSNCPAFITCLYLLLSALLSMTLSATTILPSNCPAFITCLYLLLSTLLSMTLSATTILPSNCPACITCLSRLLSALLSMTLSATTILPVSCPAFIACPCLALSSSVCPPFYDTLCYYNPNCQLPVIAFNSLPLPLCGAFFSLRRLPLPVSVHHCILLLPVHPALLLYATLL
jgi:hypothetical protein